MRFLCDHCKAKYQLDDSKVAGKTVRMKCRKCGHQIEVRAEVTETSVSARPPAAGTSQPPPRPASTRLATALAAAKPPRPAAAQAAAPGALAGAFAQAVQHEDDSATLELSDLSTAEEWYVAIAGVPVGPIRVAEIRKRASDGNVTENSLVWQEGLEEWRPLKAFPELAMAIREAAGGASYRSSSSPPPAPQRPPRPPAPPPVRAGRKHPVAPPAPERSLVPTEEFLEPETVVIADGLAMPERFSGGAFPTAAVEHPPQRNTPWAAITMVVLAAAFGVTAAIAIFLRQPQPVVVQVPASPPPRPDAPQAQAGRVSSGGIVDSMPVSADTPVPTGGRAVTIPATVVAATSTKAAPSAVPSSGLDLSSLRGGARPVMDEPGSTSRTAGQCLSEGQIRGVLSARQPNLRKICWLQGTSTSSSVSISVSLTVGPGGNVESVSATGDDPTVARCVENDVRRWTFPAGGCSQRTQFSVKFVNQ